MYTKAAIFYTHGTLSQPLLQNRIMKIFLVVFKIEGIVALTNKEDNSESINMIVSMPVHDIFL